MTVAVIGEILWDVFPGREILGGAPFNFSVHARRLGFEVAFVSAVGDDARGRAALARAAGLGLRADFVQTAAGAPTGTVSVRVDGAGQPDFTIHRPAAYDEVRLDDSTLAGLAALEPDWVYFGTLHQANGNSREQTRRLLAALPRARRFYDVNLRRDCYTTELVEELMGRADVVKLNDEEARAIDAMSGGTHSSLEEFTRRWRARMGWQAVAVTRGARGCAVRIGADYAEAAGYAVEVADTVGSGDAFAAAFLHGLSRGLDAAAAGDFANRVGALVASLPGGVPEWTMEECGKLARR